MRILFIAPYVPSRIRVRPFQIIKELSKRHEIHVLALGCEDKKDAEGVEELMSVVKSFNVVPHPKLRGYFQSLAALPTPHPMCTGFCWSSKMNDAVNEALSETKFDVIHIEHLRAAHFAPKNSSIPIVFDSVDCLTDLFRQMSVQRKSPLAKMLMAEEAMKLRKYEPRMLASFDGLAVTSDSEREALKKLDNRLSVQVVPNGVDTEYFKPTNIKKHPRRIVFSGKMSYRPNSQAALWFAENVFPRLSERWPDMEYVIVGSGPPPEIVRLGQEKGITVTGYVDDIRPYLAEASIAVVPMQIAVGVQNKVLEAMSMGLPVVLSSVAARALGDDCPGIVVADSADDVYEEVSKLIQTSTDAVKMGLKGRERVIDSFSWLRSVDLFEQLYESALSADRRK